MEEEEIEIEEEPTAFSLRKENVSLLELKGHVLTCVKNGQKMIALKHIMEYDPSITVVKAVKMFNYWVPKEHQFNKIPSKEELSMGDISEDAFLYG